MWLTIEHTTRFVYDASINEAYTELRLKPAHRDNQRCSSFTLVTEPRSATVNDYVDRFGNSVHYFDVLEPHDRLSVTVRSEVWTADAFVPSEPDLSLIDRYEYLGQSRYVPLDGAIAELATNADGDGALASAHALMHAVRERLVYERGTTDVHTRADEALAEGRGVCQDFAHVFIGACRARGIPARYVSGYLYDRNGNGDESASHAWVDVFADGGWTSLDPTHDREQTDHYVRVAVGRDYADVPPSRGIYKGNASETLEVVVRISGP